MNTITLPDELHQRLEEAAAQRGESIETFLEELLEQAEEDAALDRAMQRIKAGQAPLTWQAVQAITDPEERYDILAALATQQALDEGEEELLPWEQVKADLSLE